MRLFYFLFFLYIISHVYVFACLRRAFGGGKWQIPVALWLLAMVCLRWGCDFWNALLPRLTALTAAGNRSAYSRCTRSTSPCTNPDRGS